jgi:hypothetical protein
VTGAFAVGGKSEEWDCTLCHFSPFGNLDTPGGGVTLLGVPASYTPGQTYPLVLYLRSDSTAAFSTRKWGFEMTAVRHDDGEGVGTFIHDPDTLQVVMGEGEFASRAYLEHTDLGTRDGLAGPVRWAFSWQAPAAASGKIHFFCAANAADGTQDPGTDFIYTTSDSTLPPGSVDVPPALAARTALAPPSPNPSRGPVTLDYSLAARNRVELSIHDLQGRRVNLLASGWRGPGHVRVVWTGVREDGSAAANGVYFARLRVAGESRTISRKFVIER